MLAAFCDQKTRLGSDDERRRWWVRIFAILKCRMLNRFLQLACFYLGLIPAVSGYSVLTHEAVIDAVWMDHIQPLIKRRFPDAKEEELRRAHAFAYGGAIIQDMGYYPLGSKMFSDLTHCVRSGDFILSLLKQAQDVNDYAFALGALAHYTSDNNGHSIAINRVVPMMYPKLREKIGPVVTFSDAPAEHMKVEFSFDVGQVAQGSYAPEQYHDFIGFEVSTSVMKRAFAEVYGIDMGELFLSIDVAVGTYRYMVSRVLPTMTKAAWDLKGDEIRAAKPTITRKLFQYNLSRAAYHNEWGKTYRRPGICARMIAFFFRLVPKVGPFKPLAFHVAPPSAQTLFMKSFNATIDQYRTLLAAHGRGTLRLANGNFDTGQPLKPGQYRLADDAYAYLVKKLKGKSIPTELRANILQYYSDLNGPYSSKRHPKKWREVVTAVKAIKGAGDSQ